MKRLSLIVLAALTAVPAIASAAAKEDARFALHRAATTTKTATICSSYSPNSQNLPCTQYTVTAPVGAYSLVYMVIGQGPAEGMLGCSFGIDYNGRAGQMNGIDPGFNSFTLCADGLPFPNGSDLNMDGTVTPDEEFPAPKGGNRVTWVTCQQQDIAGVGVHAVIGALQCYAYAPDVLKMTPNNNLESGPELAIATCGGQEVQFLTIIAPSLLDMALGRVEFGGDGSQGFTPCGIVATRETTWGKVKALF